MREEMFSEKPFRIGGGYLDRAMPTQAGHVHTHRRHKLGRDLEGLVRIHSAHRPTVFCLRLIKPRYHVPLAQGAEFSLENVGVVTGRDPSETNQGWRSDVFL